MRNTPPEKSEPQADATDPAPTVEAAAVPGAAVEIAEEPRPVEVAEAFRITSTPALHAKLGDAIRLDLRREPPAGGPVILFRTAGTSAVASLYPRRAEYLRRHGYEVIPAPPAEPAPPAPV